MNTVLINGIDTDYINIMDRAFQYGDGLFETILVRDNKLQLWREHITRLRSGSEKLIIEFPGEKDFYNDIKTLIKGSNETCVFKLMLTRGVSERGYRYKKNSPTRVSIKYDVPEHYSQWKINGINVCFCDTRISSNTTLAGIKHLNRLENVLAAGELGKKYQEGFLLDDNDNVIEGTMTNYFLVKNNELYTSSLASSGISGVIRQLVIKIAKNENVKVHVQELSKENLLDADEIFVCNSILGVCSVNSLGNVSFKKKKLTRILQKSVNTWISGDEKSVV